MILSQVHTGICVSDLERSITFYRDVMGFKLIKVEEPKATRARKLGVPGAVIQIAVFEYGQGGQVELIQYLEPSAPNTYGGTVNSLGQVHISFKVDDIEQEIERMSELGVEFVGGNDCEVNADGPLKGWKWVYFKDPDGTNLELIEGDIERD
jgi:catechol 2,3-dioxygenase-like lactoylglutathione lyase family enzyme